MCTAICISESELEVKLFSLPSINSRPLNQSEQCLQESYPWSARSNKIFRTSTQISMTLPQSGYWDAFCQVGRAHLVLNPSDWSLMTEEKKIIFLEKTVWSNSILSILFWYNKIRPLRRSSFLSEDVFHWISHLRRSRMVYEQYSIETERCIASLDVLRIKKPGVKNIVSRLQ